MNCEYSRDFYVFSYFGESYESLRRDSMLAIHACGRRAYLDLNRTLNYSKESETEANSKNSQRESFVNGVCKILKEELPKLILDAHQFDEKHYALCNKIIEYASNQTELLNKDFCYGHAQKWLNMTLKYMYILGLWEMDHLSSVLHIPVDSYILEAVWRAKHKGCRTSSEYQNMCAEIKATFSDADKLFVPIQGDKEETNSSYSSAPIKAWSTWDVDDYWEFQKSIREALCGKCSPLEWEGTAWIKIAQLRNKQ